MPTLRLYQPFLNPVQFTKITPDEIPQYVSRHLDDWQFPDTILDFEQRVCWRQGWQTSDSIRLQFQSNYSPLNLKLIRAQDEVVMYDVNLAVVRTNMDDPDYKIYQADVALNPYPVGFYYLKLSVGIGGVLTLVSNVFEISIICENSLLLEYQHRKYYADVFFETGFSPSIRIPAILKMKPPGSIDTIYEDQEANMEMLKSVPYQLWTLSIGPEGIPPAQIKRLNFMLGCSNMRLDGRYYTKNEGAKLDENTVEFYPMSGWSIELREKLNRSSVIYENEIVVDGTIAVVANVDSKGFSPNDAGGSVYQVEDIQ
jgi:hypothetical protein